jgi:hypothetical protein
MPIYTFKSNDSDKEWEDVMSFTKLDEYYKEHNCQQVFYSMPEVVSQTGDAHSKTNDGFKDRMKDIHKLAGRKSRMYKGTKEQGGDK